MVSIFQRKGNLENFLYKYLTCMEPIKSIIMQTINTDISIHCRTPFTDAPHSLTV